MGKNIGFYGGGSVAELGPVTDVLSFFSCVRQFCSQGASAEDLAMLDRLYRRYVPVAELPRARRLMAGIARTFRTVPSREVQWDALGVDRASTRLDLARPTVAEVYRQYFRHFSHVTRAATYFFEDWKTDEAVRVVISDLPDMVVETSRPLEAYDRSDGQPFWLRGPDGRVPATN
jgi:hypothetical protein